MRVFRHNNPVRRYSLELKAALFACLAIVLGGCSREHASAVLPARPDLAGFPAGLTAALAKAEADVQHATDDSARWLKLGQIYHANGFYAEARQCYEGLVAKPDVGARACYFLANTAEFSGDLPAQMRWLQETLRLDPAYAPAQLLLAEVRFKSGDPVAAASSYQAVLQREPGNTGALVGLARERMRVGDDAGAAAILEKLTTEHPKFSTGLAMLAQLADRSGNTPRAATLREKARALKDPPRDDPWMEELMQSCFDAQRLTIRFEDFSKSGREKEALLALRQLEAVDPSNWLVCRMRALAASQQGREADAVAEYKRALTAGGDAATIYPGLIASLVSLGRVTEAEEIARTGLQATPNSPGLVIALAELRARQRDSAEAIRLLTEALARDPQNVSVNRSLARVYWDSGDRDRAVPCLEFIRRVAPNDIPARGMLGQFQLEKGQPAAAIAPLSEAVAIDPKNAEVRGVLALAYLRVANKQAREEHTEEAIVSYDRAIATQPDLIEAHFNKFQVCAHAGLFERAEQALAPLVTLRPRDAALFLNLGDVQQAAGKSAEALKSWKHAAELLAERPDEKLRASVAQRLEKVAVR